LGTRFNLRVTKYSHRKEKFNFELEKKMTYFVLRWKRTWKRGNTQSDEENSFNLFLCLRAMSTQNFGPLKFQKGKRPDFLSQTNPHHIFRALLFSSLEKNRKNGQGYSNGFFSYWFPCTKFIKKAFNSINLQQAKQTTK
jgi:hypothetical protein